VEIEKKLAINEKYEFVLLVQECHHVRGKFLRALQARIFTLLGLKVPMK
jgi:hypothetical protein